MCVCESVQACATVPLESQRSLHFKAHADTRHTVATVVLVQASSFLNQIPEVSRLPLRDD